MSKKWFAVVMFLSVFFSFNLVSKAESNDDLPAEEKNVKITEEQSKDALSDEEKKYLYENLGFSQQQVLAIPVDDAKMLIKSNGKSVSQFNEIVTIDDTILGTEQVEKNQANGEMIPFSKIKSSSLNLSGGIVKINSTVSGYDAFYAYCDFRWLKHTVNNYVDKIAFGLPTSIAPYFKTDGSGNIKGYYASTYVYNSDSNATYNLRSTTNPSKFNPGKGVGSSHNILTLVEKNRFNAGRINQTFYVKKSKSGKANYQFEYGHEKTKASVSFDAGKDGWGISLSLEKGNADSKSYVGSFSY